jgi:serine/threonine protein kinase
VSHANVVKTYGIFDDSTFIYVLMEYMEEGSLYRFVRNGYMDEDDATSKLL